MDNNLKREITADDLKDDQASVSQNKDAFYRNNNSDKKRLLGDVNSAIDIPQEENYLNNNNCTEDLDIDDAIHQHIARTFGEAKSEARKPSGAVPGLSRGMERRAKVWANRSKLSLTLKKYEKRSGKGFGFGTSVDKASEKLEDFMIESAKYSNDTLPWKIYSAKIKETLRSNSVNSKKSFGQKVLSALTYVWNTYMFCVGGALLIGIIGAFLYSGSISIRSVEIGYVFFVLAAAFIVYMIASVLEDVLFWSFNYYRRFLSKLDFLKTIMDALKLKIRIVIVGLWCIIGFKTVPNLLNDNSEILDIFTSAAALWIVFDIMLQFWIQRWKKSMFLKRLNDVLYGEAILRQLCMKRNLKVLPKQSLEFSEIHAHTPQHVFDEIISYLKNSELLLPLKRTHVSAQKTNYLAFEHSDNSMVAINTAAEVKLLASILFYNLDNGKFGVVTFSDWLKHYSSFKEALKAWGVLFGSLRQNFKGVDEESFLSAIKKICQDRADFSVTLKDFEVISSVLKTIISIVFWLILIVVVLLSSGVDASRVLVTFSTLLVSSAVIFGNSLKTICESLVFILYTKPYDVGDRIALSTPDSPSLLVSSIRIMTTVFIGPGNRVLIMGNDKLAAMPIFNLKRSKDAVINLVFEIDFKTPQAKITALKESTSDFLDNHKATKSSRFDFFVSNTEKANSLYLSVWFQTNFAWQEGFAVAYVRHDVISHIKNKMNELEISWKMPPQPIKLQEGVGLTEKLQMFN
jgi:small-conductance mechanosensitive channel